ncbi:hypothetical protein [Streptomyces sp. NBC_01750]|uniref:hypothetical protein n=1 Tax=Streptomyces sp. NBC_01750 TaxID=2975928 RepID=UPI002DD9EEEE|nr:hypothetical protein [Streptomyces sp. NBC_01750]WSD32301.1 hypothetical protein OG966_10515 [Streptomyces sp. NBC_01750]
MESLRLLASELVTNAVAHGDGRVGLALFFAAATDDSPRAVLRMEIADASPSPPARDGSGETTSTAVGSCSWMRSPASGVRIVSRRESAFGASSLWLGAPKGARPES